MAHLPAARIAAWPPFTAASPMRVVVSGCLAGRPCGADGTSYGEHPLTQRLLALPNVAAVGGSWLAPIEEVRRGDWTAIRDRARATVARLPK